ncbi:Thioesterase/thiol ester dehydrase-isomerase [Ramaria rubella]|nr:Thioesterase/thiol ester dehydrase-isomerase [Ramaria rubella]
MGQAVAAANKTVDASYAIHSFHCYFLQRTSYSEPITYTVEISRQGRSYATRVVKALQSSKLIFIMLSHQVPFPDNVPIPEKSLHEGLMLDRLALDPKLDAKARGYLQQFAQEVKESPIEIRLAANEQGGYVVMWWMKTVKVTGMPDKFEQPMQKSIVALMSEMNFNTTLSRALKLTSTKGPRRQTMDGSIDHALWYYSHDINCFDWILYVMTSPTSAHGRGIIQGQMYEQSGKLIAVTSQDSIARVDPRFIEQEKSKL